jgi:deoxyribose-phosphate aldolase
MDPSQLAPYLDLANHHANSTPQDIKVLCEKVIKYGFNSAFVNPYHVSFVRENFGPKLKVGTVISFPLGQDVLDIKAAAAKRALQDGADELDVSLNINLLKSDQSSSLLEMRSLVEITKSAGDEKIIKFIIETGFLTPDEIMKASELVLASSADFVKTDSGMGPRGATIEDIQLIRKAIGDKIKIKAAGGIETYDQAIAFINAGVARIGTSRAVEIITQAKPEEINTKAPPLSE